MVALSSLYNDPISNILQLQLFLSDYLDIRNTSSQSQSSPSFDEPATDIQGYFGKKRPAKVKRVSDTLNKNYVENFVNPFTIILYG